MIGFLITSVVLGISLLIISKLPLGVEVDSVWKAFVAGVVIGVLNGVLNLFPGWFKFLGAVVSLGLIPLISSTVIFGLSAWLVEGFRLRWGIWSAILGAISLTIVNSILQSILSRIGLVTL
jgi:putative membrane protein